MCFMICVVFYMCFMIHFMCFSWRYRVILRHQITRFGALTADIILEIHRIRRHIIRKNCDVYIYMGGSSIIKHHMDHKTHHKSS